MGCKLDLFGVINIGLLEKKMETNIVQGGLYRVYYNIL